MKNKSIDFYAINPGDIVYIFDKTSDGEYVMVKNNKGKTKRKNVHILYYAAIKNIIKYDYLD